MRYFLPTGADFVFGCGGAALCNNKKDAGEKIAGVVRFPVTRLTGIIC